MADKWRTHAPGASSPGETERRPEEEPDTRGTLVLTLIMLIFIGGGWLVAYFLLIGR